MKTKFGTEVAHVTRDSDTTFKVKGQLAGGGAYCGGLPHSLLHSESCIARWNVPCVINGISKNSITNPKIFCCLIWNTFYSS